MEQWHYTKEGKQHGPIGLEELRNLVASGAIDKNSDFVWNPTMTDWLPPAELPIVIGSESVATPTGGEQTQPFAYPTATGAFEEIIPGSEPIIPTACIKRAFDLTVTHIGSLIAVALIWLAIAMGMSILFEVISAALGLTIDPNSNQTPAPAAIWYGIGSQIAQSLVAAFLTLGATRICLNIVSGKEFSIGMLFGQGDKLIRAFFAQILFGLLIFAGLILLIVPGIYFALRYGMYMNAIVDKNMGIMEAFSYSSRITQNNRLNLFVIALLSILITLAGCIALIVGLLFAYPMIMLTWVIAYRWMQYGGRTVMDDPNTKQPLLAQLPE
ncbi:MAG: DUF4339 domain-containing protein [Akkermansiaceae bacterium]